MTKSPEVTAIQPDTEATEDSPPVAAETAAASSIEEKLMKAELAAAGHHDAWLRAKAEADNIRKRAQAEVASAHKFAVENFSAELHRGDFG